MRSVWQLIKHAASSWSDIDAPRLGAAIAFYAMLSMAPLMVLCIGIAGLAFGKDAAQGQILAQLQSIIGVKGASVIQELLRHASRPSSGILAASTGVVVVLFGASSVLGELRDSLNAVWGAKPAGSTGLWGIVQYRFVSFAMVLGIGFLLLVSLVLSAAISAAGHFFSGFLPVSGPLLHLGNLLFSFLSVTVLFALLYKFVPDAPVEWRDVWMGAAVTSVLFSVGKTLIGFYLGITSVGSVYGAAGSLVAFIVWVYYSAQIFLLGAEFTHAFAERHGSRAPERRGPAREEGMGLRRPRVA